MALDDALNQLSQLDEQQSRIVEMRFFGGLTIDEIGEVLGISRSTVKREWNVAKAWLTRQMKRGGHALISERFRSPKLTYVCHRCRDKHIGSRASRQ